MSGAVSMALDLSAFNASISALEQDVSEAVRPAAQAGAEVFYRAVLRNVQALGKKTGNLAGSIYQAFSAQNSGPAKATYHVSWNARKAPHGHLVEFGHMQRFKVYVGKDGRWYTNKSAPLPAPKHVAARPFLRPAYARADEAAAAVEATFWQVLGQ